MGKIIPHLTYEEEARRRREMRQKPGTPGPCGCRFSVRDAEGRVVDHPSGEAYTLDKYGWDAALRAAEQSRGYVNLDCNGGLLRILDCDAGACLGVSGSHIDSSRPIAGLGYGGKGAVMRPHTYAASVEHDGRQWVIKLFDRGRLIDTMRMPPDFTEQQAINVKDRMLARMTGRGW